MRYMIKLYRITFIEYLDPSRETIYSPEFHQYIDSRDMIVKESDIEYFKSFGNGIKSLEFVGYMHERPKRLDNEKLKTEMLESSFN